MRLETISTIRPLMPAPELRPLPGEGSARGLFGARPQPEAVREHEPVRPSAARDPHGGFRQDIGWLAQQIAQEVTPEEEPEESLSARASHSYAQWNDDIRVLGPVRPFAFTA